MTLREALWLAVVDRQKLVAMEAFPAVKDFKQASSMLAKILGPNADRGDAVFAAIEAALRFGDREALIAYFDRRLKPADARALLGLADHAINKQLGLFDAQVKSIEEMKRLRDELEEAVARAPVERRRA